MAAPSSVNRLDLSARSFGSCDTALSSVRAQTQYENHPAAQTLSSLVDRLSSGNQVLMPPAGRLKQAFVIALDSRQPPLVREEAIKIIFQHNRLEFGGTSESVPVLPRKLYKLANVIERTPALRHLSGRAEQAINSIHRELRAELSNMRWGPNYNFDSSYSQMTYTARDRKRVQTQPYYYYKFPASALTGFGTDIGEAFKTLATKRSSSTESVLDVQRVRELIDRSLSSSDITDRELIKIINKNWDFDAYKRTAEKVLLAASPARSGAEHNLECSVIDRLSTYTKVSFTDKGQGEYIGQIAKQPASPAKANVLKDLLGQEDIMRCDNTRQKLVRIIKQFPEGHDKQQLLKTVYENSTGCLTRKERKTLGL